MTELLLLLVLAISIALLVLLAMLLARERASAREARDELARAISMFAQNITGQFETLRGAVEQRLERIQQDNASKLEQMRQTVDEKLHATLKQRLSESFRQVSERLELVHKGLGEMQSLAAGVGDLKRVLTNVKARGTWGEVQLGALLVDQAETRTRQIERKLKDVEALPESEEQPAPNVVRLPQE